MILFREIKTLWIGDTYKSGVCVCVRERESERVSEKFKSS